METIILIVLVVVLVLCFRDLNRQNNEISKLKEKLYLANEQLEYGKEVDAQCSRGMASVRALARMAHVRMLDHFEDPAGKRFAEIFEATVRAEDWIREGKGIGDKSDADYPFTNEL